MPEGIRPYLYSTKMDVNPTTYEIINTDDYSGVHAKGCVWATALYEGYWNIVDEEGFDADFFYTRGGGNGMALQVCDCVTSRGLGHGETKIGLGWVGVGRSVGWGR